VSIKFSEKLKMDSNLLSHFAWWLGVPKKAIEPYWPQISQTSLKLENLRISASPLSDQVARKFAFFIMEHTHPSSRAPFRSTLKALRRFINRTNLVLPDMAPITDTLWHQTLKNLKQSLKESDTLPSLKTGFGPAICLTHDIDTIDCYESVPALADLEQKYGIPSVFNFLTAWDYPYNSDLAKNLHSEGFEIGLHGLTHDIALGYRSPQLIRYHIEKALDQLGVPVCGYRAPAFAISDTLMKILDDLNFKYDSSMHLWHPMYPSLGLSFPYQYPTTKIIEFPLSIEDAMIFGDFSLNENQAMRYIEKTLTAVMEIGGVFVLNIHPSRIKTQFSLVEGVLKIINETNSQVLKTTPKFIVDSFYKNISQNLKTN
jgi:peptidoglycan/xylan/chitin deacetylase (PgdA/CDA1 family)